MVHCVKKHNRHLPPSIAHATVPKYLATPPPPLLLPPIMNEKYNVCRPRHVAEYAWNVSDKHSASPIHVHGELPYNDGR